MEFLFTVILWEISVIHECMSHLIIWNTFTLFLSGWTRRIFYEKGYRWLSNQRKCRCGIVKNILRAFSGFQMGQRQNKKFNWISLNWTRINGGGGEAFHLKGIHSLSYFCENLCMVCEFIAKNRWAAILCWKM